MIVCAGEIESFSFAKPIGIGLVDSAINLTELCIVEKPTSLLFVGSAGSFGKFKPFDIVECSSSTNVENSSLVGGSYTPLRMDVSRETIDIVNSSNYITTDKSLSELYRKQNIELENMEFYAVQQVAKKFDIPSKAILIVTNYCDEFAHEEFVLNHKQAMGLLTDYIKENEL